MSAHRTATATPQATWAAIDRACGPEGPADLIGELHRRLGTLVPHDAAFLATTDPLTGLATSPAVVDNLGEEYCGIFWEQEFGGDLLPFTELARGPRRAGGLVAGSSRGLAASGRVRRMLRPSGLVDEARVVFTSGGAVWGIAALYRAEGAEAFDERELAVLERLAPLAGEGLRRRTLDTPADSHGMPMGPGLVLLDESMRIISMNDDAEEWLRLMPADPYSRHRPSGVRPAVMTEIVNVARRAAAPPGPGGASEQPPASRAARLRVRTAGGLWLVVHASRLSGEGGGGPVAVVIEAAKGSEMAPIIAEALGLTAREQEITTAVARGEGTGEIAARLHLSPHTVRDHLKAIFEKAGVSSRGELVARLFADHYLPRSNVHAAAG